MYVIEWTIIESLSDSTSNFFEVPGSIQKVVKFKGRINVQLPGHGRWQPLVAQLALLALLAGCTRSRFENSFKMYVIEWTIIESLSDSTSNFLRYRAQFKK